MELRVRDRDGKVQTFTYTDAATMERDRRDFLLAGLGIDDAPTAIITEVVLSIERPERDRRMGIATGARAIAKETAAAMLQCDPADVVATLERSLADRAVFRCTSKGDR